MRRPEAIQDAARGWLRLPRKYLILRSTRRVRRRIGTPHHGTAVLPRLGIPSHDTFGRVFDLLDPEQFGACFMDWVRSVSELAQGVVVAIDGKTLRGCHDRANGRGALHMVSPPEAEATENRMVLGQTRTEAHSNEITAIPELIMVMELKGCPVPIDPPPADQNQIARHVARDGADYLLAVKANQRSSSRTSRAC